MAHWIRFERDGQDAFGTLVGDRILVHGGDMFSGAAPTGASVPLASVRVLTPCEPTKMVALWNNFGQLAAKLGTTKPDHPLYLLKAPSSFLAHGEPIRRPAAYQGKIVYEGELAIVIGRRIADADPVTAAAAIFGYTCTNDVTAADIIAETPSFAQWVRAKSFDTFGVFGPVIATGLDPLKSSVRTVLNGAERQNYPLSDMFYPPAEIVARISQDMTLEPGDVICCGTSIGVGVMKEASNRIEVTIDGIGTLSNSFDQPAA
jgi:2-keto-4-pentenoate hydratase/2-oxohepta-3-ene-1,7-dioic acid hydratase in catechol pathway